MKKMKITIELDAEETDRFLRTMQGLIQRIASPSMAPEVVDASSEVDENEEAEIHDCLDSVEVEYVEDFEGSYQLVTCMICGCDVSAEYEEAYPEEDDDFDAWRDFQAGDGWWP